MALLIMGSSMLSAQGIRDSIFPITGVEVTAAPLFEKESAGMKMTLVDTAVLWNKSTLSLSDLLSENTSVFIKDHGRGALATASFRGSAASHTQVQWNGLRINNPMAGMVDFSLIPVYLIDQVSLYHGPSSLVTGGGGIGGTIHIQNVAKWEERTSVKYIQGIGSYRTFDEFLQLGYGNGKIRFNTRMYHNYSGNDYPYVNHGIGSLDPATGKIIHPVEMNDHAAYLRYGLLQEIYFRPGASQLLSLRYWGQFADRSIPRPSSYEGPDPSGLNNQQDGDHRMVADWNLYGETSHWTIRTGFSRKSLDYTHQNRVPGLGLIPVVASHSIQQSLYNSVGHTYTPLSDLSLEGRIDFNLHDVQSGDSVSRTGYERRRHEMAMLLTVTKSFFERLNLNLMLRQDWIDGERAPFSPYLGFDLLLIKREELIFKGNVARNYHQPTLNDLYWQPGGNPDLLPEEGFSMEAGLEYRTLLAGQQIRTELTAYRSDIREWIIWIPGFKGYWEPRNIARVISSGVEYALQVAGKFREIGYQVMGNYALTRSLNLGDPEVWGDLSHGKQLVYIPLHSGNLMMNLSYREFFVTYQYNAYSERYTTTSNDPSRRYRLSPYFMNTLTAGWSRKFDRIHFSAEVRIYNLFNESYRSILFRPMPGRNYSLLLMFKI